MTTIGERIKERRLSMGLSVDEVATRLHKNRATIYRYESDEIDNLPISVIAPLAKVLHVTPAYLMGWEEDLPSNAAAADLISLPVIGSIRAGYDGACIEELTGEEVYIDRADLHGRPLSDFFVLSVKGDSMFPMFLDGDMVLIERISSVDSGTVAAILYNGEEATLKKVEYKKGEDWLDLVPVNPMYQTKHIEGCDLASCRVLGEVVQLIRKFKK